MQMSTLALRSSRVFLFRGTKTPDPGTRATGEAIGWVGVRCAVSLGPRGFLRVPLTSQTRHAHVFHPRPTAKPSFWLLLGADTELPPPLPGPRGPKRSERGLQIFLHEKHVDPDGNALKQHNKLNYLLHTHRSFSAGFSPFLLLKQEKTAGWRGGWR